MKYCKTIQIIFSATIISILVASACSKKMEYRNIDGFAQGTTFHISYSPDVTDSLNGLVSQVLNDIDNSLSVYNDTSIISRLNRGENVKMDTLFINVFDKSREIYNISQGAFDISGAPLFDAWGFGFKNKINVTQKDIDSILTFVGMDKVKIVDGKLIKNDPRLTLNANAIAQGYTSDVIAQQFDKRGIRNYMIEVGGEIFCKGANSKGKDWTVGIDKPIDGNMIKGEELQDVISLTGRGLATSGNYRNFYEKNGEKYAHTIDPKTGYPVQHSLLSATVIAKDAMTADALATFFMVVGIEKAKDYLEKNPEIDALLVYSEKGKFQVFKTKGVNIIK